MSGSARKKSSSAKATVKFAILNKLVENCMGKPEIVMREYEEISKLITEVVSDKSTAWAFEKLARDGK